MLALTSNLRQDLREKLENGYKIKPFPEAVSRLLAAIKDPDSSATKIAQIIETDAGLASRLLGMANSPLFGLSREVNSINHAIVLLGMRSIKDLAITFAGSSLMGRSNEVNDHRQALWSHSLACAISARELAKTRPAIEPNQAFLAGIFHDVGKLLFLDLVSDEYHDLIDRKFGSSLTAHEIHHFGVSHEMAGEQMMNAWKLPEPLIVSSAFHHRPQSAPSNTVLAELVGQADLISHALGIGSGEGIEFQGAEHLVNDLALKIDDLEAFGTKVELEFRQMNGLL